jgi:hypothetical protein
MSFDTDVNNYTISELLTILDLEEDDIESPYSIIDKTDNYIQKFIREKKGDMATFFKDIQNRLISKSDVKEGLESIRQEKAEVKKQDNHVVNTSEKTSTDSNSFSVPVAKGTLNPNLKNVTNRIIVMDSQYRQASRIGETSTDYTLDLSEQLTNVLSLRLYSYSIPYTWYTIDPVYGNTCFWITIPIATLETISVAINLQPGTYTTKNIIAQLTNSFVNVAGFNVSGLSSLIDPYVQIPTNVPFFIDPISGRLTMNFYGATYIYDGQTYTIDERTVITFFDTTNNLSTTTTGNSSFAINQTLGWNLGFREPFSIVNQNGNKALSVIDLYGPKYFVIVIDDLNQNHINNGLVTITEVSKHFKLPSYYKPDYPTTVIPPNPTNSNLAVNSVFVQDNEDAGVLLMDKLNTSYKGTYQVLPSSPRVLTQAQIYAINEIMKNNNTANTYKLVAPVVSDVFAIIPMKLAASSVIGDVITEYGGTLQDNKRQYFGPINITRLRIRLIDDKGNTVNLNGADWCFTLISENLYQY